MCTCALFALLLPLVLKDVFETFVYDDLVLVLLDTAKARVGFEAGEARVRHGG